ncbi:hypothetical protein D3OALGA1CA_3698 [Olavius algarvensis associated proteobacterium Delta 3]|nr:hypothetical protein D3OALGA1CA_3698 [Olavius algarvensis associated proteobacterium Delta 3]
MPDFDVDTDSEPDTDTDDSTTFSRVNNPQIGTAFRQLLYSPKKGLPESGSPFWF